jgi:hypothetical protein
MCLFLVVFFCFYHRFNLVRGQFCNQVILAPFQSQLRWIEPWSSLLSSEPITTEPTNDWLFLAVFVSLFLVFLILILILDLNNKYNCMFHKGKYKTNKYATRRVYPSIKTSLDSRDLSLTI